MIASLTIPEQSADIIKKEILAADNLEVMFVAAINEKREIINPRAVARGNAVSVPALLPHAQKGDLILHNHPSGNLRPSEADLAIAGYLGNLGIGFVILNNNLSNIRVIAEPVVIKDNIPLDFNKLEELFLPSGGLARLIDDYEIRDPQIGMLNAVTAAFNEDQIVAIEAGTGVGKSLAYLVPAIKWASDNDERIVISTATINLQRQLMEKDIPLAEKTLGCKVKTVLVKGRGNYICLRRLYEEMDEPSLFAEEKDELAAILNWSLNSSTGDKSELSFIPAAQLWQRICSETDSCAGLRCARREDCFIIKARKEAAQSQLLIANHHLLFSDISLRAAGVGYDNAAVLPPFQRVILDEAHTMEKSATSFFSSVFTKNSVSRQLNRLLYNKRGNNSGLLIQLQKCCPPADLFEDMPEKIDIARLKIDELNQKCLFLLADASSVRITENNKTEIGKDVFPVMTDFQNSLNILVNKLQKIAAFASDILENDDEHIVELKSVINRLGDIASIVSDFINKAPENENVYWFERHSGSRGDKWIEFSVTPVDISRIMKEALFAQYGTIICASATLRINKDFKFWIGRVGLSDLEMRETKTGYFPSPFPYKTNTLLCVPTDVPEPSSQDYLPVLKKRLFDLLELTEGKALILFTSYQMLKDAYEELYPKLESIGIRSLKQGDGERFRLLEHFKRDTKSVLFATDSFWEGVDSPGETLQVVVICRLPFRVPSDPIVMARMEAIERKGGNPFMDLSVPEAIMKFKQGFGRLMRKKTDKGIVVIYDSRIIKKHYGKYFLNSLPETGLSIKDSGEMLIDIENFFY